MEAGVHAESQPTRAASVFRLLFMTAAALVVAAAGYAGWIIIRTWSDVGV
jgi:hypothetical protein